MPFKWFPERCVTGGLVKRSVTYGISGECGMDLDDLFLDITENLPGHLGCKEVAEYRGKDCITGYCFKINWAGGKRATLKRRKDRLVLVLPDDWSVSRLSDVIGVNEGYITLLGRTQ